jgi:Omp85 superfamily domain
LQFPQLASGHANLDVHAQRYDFPDEDFFGIGPDSTRENFVEYGLTNTVVGATAAFQPMRRVSFTAGVDYFDPTIDALPEPGRLFSVFTPDQAPGALEQPSFLKYEGGVEFNNRVPRGNPRSGGRYALNAQRFEDIDSESFAFDRVEIDLQQYVPLLRDRRVLALHGLASFSNADAGAEIPFYLQRTLGGPDDLRGFRVFRFRDRHMLLLQAEYRWEIFTAVDGAIFYDAGKVASRAEDINFRDLETDYGIGFRFGTINGTFLRIEGAFGSRDGKHFILRFHNVF